jgi:hypothetical protein
MEVSMRTTVCCTVLLLIFSSTVFGQVPIGTESWDRSVELRSYFCMNQQESSNVPESVASVHGRKNPAVGILLSAAVPGAGEIYSGSWIKGAIFLSIETGLWIYYAQFENKGKDWEDIFHAYADEHWSKEQWEYLGGNQDEGTHTLPSTKTQQYYEMIGKYDQFMEGWDDWVQGGPSLTPHRDHYETLRDNSNKELIKASYCAMIVLANHVISAFDASWSVKRHNRKIESKTRIGLQKVRDEYVPMLSMDLSW